MIESSRIRFLNQAPARKAAYVLYWMQAAPRVLENPALELAAARADELGLPLLCAFSLTARYPEANLRHYAFLLQGLAETERALREMGILLAVLAEEPDRAALRLAPQAALVVTDRGYLRHQRAWRERVAAGAPCQVVQVEGELVLPLEEASGKLEWAAASFRPKVRRLLLRRRSTGRSRPPRRDSLGLSVDGPVVPADSLADGRTLERLRIDRTVPPVPRLPGGTTPALERLRRFLGGPLAQYHLHRNDPSAELQSGLSPYLHFGQICPLTVSHAVRRAKAPVEAIQAFLEELIVRRELSYNLVFYNPAYDRYEGLPEWARATLARHARDRRPYSYGRNELEEAGTHDPYWNAAMQEMRRTGTMHGYMRMYWGKKILEWSETPEQAFDTALALNNRWFLDGRDPNSYAGIAWCFGRHDRPWPERPVFGTVRAMTAGGLRRKFDMDGYLRRIAAL